MQGCDGSVLLDSKPYGGKTEKEAKNNIGLDGFDVIDQIKSELDYPEKVSCADILVLAAREATFILSRGNIDYAVKTGRMDGVVSSAASADAVLPPSTFNITQLKADFAAKGFNTRELVALSGAHAVGVAHLSSFADRLHDSTATPISDQYREALAGDVKKQKKVQGTQDPIEPNNIRDKEFVFRNASGYDDTGVDTSKAARGVLDNSYYHANLQNNVLFRSDWELRNDTTGIAGSVMDTFEADANKWYLQFGNAMAKLSKLPAEGKRFEIRKDCRKTN
jgi:peroxidase